MGKRPVAKQPLESQGLTKPGRPIVAFYGHRAGLHLREFSNFYVHREPFEFVLPTYVHREGFPRSVWCSFSEKAIMASKAALMGDLEVFKEIDSVVDPAKCKALGRQVRNFDHKLWNLQLEEIAAEVVLQKFSSEKKLRDLLLSTGDAILCEAAPNDKIWGIGLSVEDTRTYDQSQWLGRNILGFALMKARDQFRGSAALPIGGVGISTTADDSDKPSLSCAARGAATAPAAKLEEPPAVSQKSTRRWGKSQSKEESSHGQPNSSSLPAFSAVAAATTATPGATVDASMVSAGTKGQGKGGKRGNNNGCGKGYK